MSWTVMIDPPAIAGSPPANRTALSLNSGGILIDQKGIDWGDSQIQTYLADRRVGSIKIDFRMPNRKVTIPLFLMDDPSGSLTEEQVRAMLQQKVGTIQMSGGWLMRQRAGGPATYADIVDAVLTLPDIWGETGGIEPSVNLILECSPDFYGDELTLDVATVSGGALTGALQLSGSNAVIQGDHMGRANIIVTDTSGFDQTSLIWAFRQTYYDPSSTAHLVYSASALNPISPATTGTTAGRTTVISPALPASPSWTPIVQTDVGGSSPMTHLGSYRIRARVYTASTTNVWLRLVWGVGAAIGITANDLVLIPGSSSFYIIDLGEIRVDFPPIGTLRWEGQIQGQGQNGGETVAIDQIYLQPLDDSAGYATASKSVSSLASPAARDGFNQTGSPNLSGGTVAADLGGNWTQTNIGTSSGNFGYDTTNHNIFKTAILSYPGPSYLTLGGVSHTDVDVSADIGFASFALTSTGQALTFGVLGRWVDGLHWFGAAITYLATSNTFGTTFVQLLKVNSASSYTATVMSSVVVNKLPVLPATNRLELSITSAGIARAYLNGTAAGLVNDSDLASGGVLASGQAGLFEYQADAGIRRQYDNFLVYPTAPNDAVCYAHSSASLRYDGMYRSDTTNTYFGPMANVVGDLPRLPPSGVENRPVELFLMMSRGDLAQQADIGLGSFTAQVRYRPVHIHRA